MADHWKESKRIGRNLKKIRLQKNLTQMEVAVATNLSRSYIGKIETGKARVTFVLLLHLVRGLGIKSGDLIEF